ncbi:MAG: hypothetical protein Q9162_002812 [Coniocarpon cinnabarinum]
MRTMVEAILGVNADEPMQKALVTKVKDNGSHLGQDQILQAEPSEPIEFDMGALLQWQYEFNEGHVYALYDTIRHGPSVGQEHLWSRFAGLMTEKVQSQPRNTLSRTKLIVVFGADDDVVVRAEAKEDILEILPDDKVDFARVPGSHGFVYPNSNQIVDIIAHAWVIPYIKQQSLEKLDRSRSQRILWLLEELEVPYELKVYKRQPDGNADPRLREIHPLGKSPLITVQPEDESLPARTIAESAAIVEYVCDHFGQHLIPQRWQEGQNKKVAGETEEWMRYRHFMHYSEGSLMSVLMTAMIIMRIRDAPVPFFIKPIVKGIAGKVQSSYLEPNFETHYSFLENQLSTSSGDYLCGKDLTGADIMMQFPLEGSMDTTGLTKDKYPKTYAYVSSLMEREAYKKSIERVKKETGSYQSVKELL